VPGFRCIGFEGPGLGSDTGLLPSKPPTAKPPTPLTSGRDGYAGEPNLAVKPLSRPNRGIFVHQRERRPQVASTINPSAIMHRLVVPPCPHHPQLVRATQRVPQRPTLIGVVLTTDCNGQVTEPIWPLTGPPTSMRSAHLQLPSSYELFVSGCGPLHASRCPLMLGRLGQHHFPPRPATAAHDNRLLAFGPLHYVLAG
jgi:hypothetical protein